MDERLGIVGGGVIACGLATVAACHGDVAMWVRSADAKTRARATVARNCARLDGEVDADRVKVHVEPEALSDATVVIEAIIEDQGTKSALWRGLTPILRPDALLGSTTSSLSVQALAEASGAPERFIALHVFNPVPKMSLVELAFPAEATPATRGRAFAFCEDLGKTAVAVPDLPGFVVNRLLFPFLFSAVTLRDETGLDADAVDACLQLGAGHPMGPLALLDFVGLDVAQSIGEALGTPVPAGVSDLVAQGHLGRKTGRGFYDYDG